MVLQTWPVGQPLQRPPQPLSSLHVLFVQSGTHSQTPALHSWFAAGHAPFWQMPPQPSSSPQLLVSQFGRQHSQPIDWLVQISPVPGHPLQTLPHPSATPHPLVTQLGTHVHLPSLQVSFGAQLSCPERHIPPQPSGPPHVVHVGVHGGAGGAGGFGGANRTQESMHAPPWQMKPAAQVTSEQGLATHFPLWQVWPAGHVTPAHRSGAQATRLHVAFGPQLAAQAVMAAHWPVCREQYWPAGHFTPAHGTG
jgi:hypothetical protein